MAMRDLIPFNRSRETTPVSHFENDSPIFSLQREMNRMFDSFFRGTSLSPFEHGFGGGFPTVDVQENDHDIVVTAELPGVNDKDLNILISENLLTLSGEKRAEREEKKSGYYHMERAYGAFHRDIVLPCEVKDDQVEAEFKRGVLTVTLPKKEEAKRKAKRIAIKSA